MWRLDEEKDTNKGLWQHNHGAEEIDVFLFVLGPGL